MAYLENVLEDASGQLQNLDVDIEILIVKLTEVLGQLEEMVVHRLNEEITSKEAEISSLESKKNAYESLISGQEQIISQTRGSARIGCLYSFLFFLAIMRLSVPSVLLGVLILCGGLTLLYIAGVAASRWNRTRPFRSEIDKARAGLAKWDAESLPRVDKAKAEAATARQAMSEFLRRVSPSSLDE